MEYSRKMDWQINNSIKVELVKRWIDVQKLRITAVKGNIELKGELIFTGKMADDLDHAAIANYMKILDMALKGIPNVRSIKWELTNWQKTGVRWAVRSGSKEEKEQQEQQGGQGGGQGH